MKRQFYYTTMSSAEEAAAAAIEAFLDEATYGRSTTSTDRPGDLFASVYLKVRLELPDATALHNQPPARQARRVLPRAATGRARTSANRPASATRR
jgi:hypothetical protein